MIASWIATSKSISRSVGTSVCTAGSFENGLGALLVMLWHPHSIHKGDFLQMFTLKTNFSRVGPLVSPRIIPQVKLYFSSWHILMACSVSCIKALRCVVIVDVRSNSVRLSALNLGLPLG